MRKIIINLNKIKSEEQINSIIQASFNQGFVDFNANGKTAQKLVKIQRCTVFSNDLTINRTIPILNLEDKDKITTMIEKSLKFGVYIEVKSKEQENLALELANQGVPVVICKSIDWKVIPFENLIARFSSLDSEIYVDIDSSLSDAELLLHILELGVDGLVFSPQSENDLIELKKLLSTTESLSLESATIKNISFIPEADRVCVDTSSILKSGEGMLVGNTAMGFALIHAEVFDSEFVKSRPFRVNAGDVSEYILVPADRLDISTEFQTKYLSELQSGDKVLIVNKQGNSRIVSVGRVKIETRPMLLLKLEVNDEKKRIPLKVTVQNAETVMLVRVDGQPVSVTKLKIGDKVLVYLGPGATHFGVKIKERIIEK